MFTKENEMGCNKINEINYYTYAQILHLVVKFVLGRQFEYQADQTE